MCGECCRLGLACAPRTTAKSNLQHTLPLIEQLQMESTAPENVQELDGSYTKACGSSVHQPTSQALDTKEYLAWVALLDENYDSNITLLGHFNNSSALAYRGTSNGSAVQVHVDTALKNFPGIDCTAVAEWHPTERHLLNHFLQVVSRGLVVVNDDVNPFLVEILPMAIENLSVRHALLALSARQICRVYTVFEDTRVSQQTLALHHLKLELQKTVTTEHALASTLLMCLCEICQGNSRKWILYLYGAKALIESRTGRGSTSQFLSCLYEHLCCMAALTSKKVPFLDITLNECPFHSLSPHPKQRIHPLMGLAGDLYSCLKYINQFTNQRSERTDSLENKTTLESWAEPIQTYLENWSPPEVDEHIWNYREAVSAAQAVRWACAIWLQHVLYGYAASSETRQEALDEIMSVISCIRPGSSFDTQLLFPLFMAGVSAKLKSERLRIEYRLKILESTTGMGNVAGAHRILDDVWKHMNEGLETAEWETMLQVENGGVVLL